MVWAGATSKGLKTPLIFIEEGVKINQTVLVLPWVQEVVGEQGVTLQQDGATSHTANSKGSKYVKAIYNLLLL